MTKEKNTNTVTKNFSVAMYKGADPIGVTVELDFTGVEKEELMQIATKPAIIDFQAVLRKTSEEFVKSLPKPYKLHIRNAGKSIKTPEQMVNDLVASGVPRKMAEIIVNSPEKMAQFEKMIDGK